MESFGKTPRRYQTDNHDLKCVCIYNSKLSINTFERLCGSPGISKCEKVLYLEEKNFPYLQWIFDNWGSTEHTVSVKVMSCKVTMAPSSVGNQLCTLILLPLLCFQSQDIV